MTERSPLFINSAVKGRTGVSKREFYSWLVFRQVALVSSSTAIIDSLSEIQYNGTRHEKERRFFLPLLCLYVGRS